MLSIYDVLWFDDGLNVQLAPDHRYSQLSIVGSGVEHFIRVGIEAMLGTFTPQYRPVGVRTGNAKQGESGDCEREFEGEERDECFGNFPMARDEHCAGLGTGRLSTIRSDKMR